MTVGYSFLILKNAHDCNSFFALESNYICFSAAFAQNHDVIVAFWALNPLIKYAKVCQLRPFPVHASLTCRSARISLYSLVLYVNIANYLSIYMEFWKCLCKPCSMLILHASADNCTNWCSCKLQSRTNFFFFTGVGKSCLLLRFSDGSFTTSFITTIGFVVLRHLVNLAASICYKMDCHYLRCQELAIADANSCNIK